MTSPATARLLACSAGLLVMLWMVAGIGSQPTAQADEWQDLVREAEGSVESAKKSISSRRLNEEMLAALATAQAAVEAVRPPEKPGLVPVDPKEGETEQAAEENKRRLAKWTRACGDWRERVERLRSRWVEVLGKFLVEQKVFRQTERNHREEVNRRALELLVATGRADAATVVARAFTGPYLEGPRYPSSQGILRELLEAMVHLRSFAALDVLREVITSKDRMVRLMNVRVLPPAGGAPAADAHALFLRVIEGYENVPGQLRYLLVRDLVETYAPMEQAAAGGGAAAAVWNRIREAAVDATWHHAGRPTHDTGARLATLHELEAWFRANRSRHRPAWTD